MNSTHDYRPASVDYQKKLLFHIKVQYLPTSKCKEKVILILIILKLSRCSLVLDSMSQNTLYVSNYCPSMKNCIEGSHVICQYYNHHHIVGQLCKNYVKVSITPQMVQQILEGVNKIRMKLATGEETGRDEQPLPRAYGMMRMHWDSELATLAQVLADQCLGLKEDTCRATDKFSNPSQIITLINFNAPNWEYLTRNSTDSGLNDEKIRSSIDKAFKSLHTIKKLISTNDINKCPVLEILPDKGSRSYLKLIRGKATHIGCGISAYTRSQVLSSGSQHIYNSIQLVCNVSDGPVHSQPIYTTDPPIPETGFTEKCGCPEGYRDSTGCLCEKDAHGNIENTEIQWRHFNLDKLGQSHETEPCDDPDGICDGKSNVMVLPIFEIHDAPNDSYEPENDVEMQFHRSFGNASFIQTSMEENEISDDEVYPETESGFSKMLKNDNRNYGYRRAISSEQREKEVNAAASVEGTAEHNDHYTSMEDNIVEHDPRKNSGYDDRMAPNDVDRDHTEEENSFLDILDHLERAVKNIELDGEERKIFDFKMRKIYEAALKSKAQHESEELEDEFKKLTDYLKHRSDTELEDESVQSDKEEEMFDYINRRDNYSDEFYNGIDEKLIQILTKKHHHRDDYFSKDHKTDAHNSENDAYTNYPASRKQENLNNYDKNLIKSNKRESNVDNRNQKTLRTPVNESRQGAAKKMIHKKIYDNRQNKMTGDKRKIDTINKDQAIKTFGRRTFTYPEHKARRIPVSPRYRRVFETEKERPTQPTTTQADKIKVEIIPKKKYLKRDRPIL